MIDQTENELELWLETEEAARIDDALDDGIGELPGESVIAEKLVAAVLSPTPNRVTQLELGLHRWRIAAVFAVAACVALSLLMFSRPVPMTREAAAKTGDPGSNSRVSKVAEKLAGTRGKLARLSPSSDFSMTRKFKR